MIEQALRIAADEKKKQADLQAAEDERRHARFQVQQQERAEQAKNRRVQYEAERRLANETQQLRSVCMRRYVRLDC